MWKQRQNINIEKGKKYKKKQDTKVKKKLKEKKCRTNAFNKAGEIYNISTYYSLLLLLLLFNCSIPFRFH